METGHLHFPYLVKLWKDHLYYCSISQNWNYKTQFLQKQASKIQKVFFLWRISTKIQFMNTPQYLLIKKLPFFKQHLKEKKGFNGKQKSYQTLK